jgi:hypothetical protein
MVNIDTVYQTVLTLANKEQRGYITPQEFNLLANQAQMNIFEQYFYDINQFQRMPGNDTGHSDVLAILEEKIAVFEHNAGPLYIEENFQPVWGSGAELGIELPEEVYRIGDVRLKSKNPKYSIDYGGNIGRQWTQVEILTPKQFNSIVYNPKPLIRPTLDRPIGYLGKAINNKLVQISPTDTYTPTPNARSLFIAYDMKLAENMYGGVEVVWVGIRRDNDLPEWPLEATRLSMDYIKKPTKVQWGYNVIREKALYNPNTSIHFELHESEQVELINKILALAGIVVRTPELYSVATQEETRNIQQEKQ